MFNERKSLIVVYKDELLVNQLKKLVETNDDKDQDNAIGTRDKSISIVAWNEKMWLEQKKKGNFTSKILFVGNIKGMDKLIPILDIKFSEYGVYYGWAGSQAVVFTKAKDISDRDSYQEFLNKLAEYPVPDDIKTANRIERKDSETVEEKVNVLRNLVNNVNKASEEAANLARDLFKDKKMMEKQMLFYGIINLYNKDLESFMKG